MITFSSAFISVFAAAAIVPRGTVACRPLILMLLAASVADDPGASTGPVTPMGC